MADPTQESGPNARRDSLGRKPHLGRRTFVTGLAALGAGIGGAALVSGQSDSAEDGESEMIITATGSTAIVNLTVSGTITPGRSFDEGSADSISSSGASATLRVGGTGKDAIFYTGAITSFSIDGTARVTIDGTRVNPDSLGNGSVECDPGTEPTPEPEPEPDPGEGTRTLTFEGSPGGAYAFAVSGTIEKSTAMDASINSFDEISGSTASGGVGGGRDSYTFSGEITDFETDDGVTVYLDGDQVDPVSLGDSSGSDGSGSGDSSSNGQALFIFDDGNDSALFEAKPVLDDFGFGGCTAVITDRPSGTGSSYLTRGEIDELADAGWEIASHTVNHDKLTTLSRTEWKQEVRWSAKDLDSWGYESNCFVYPKGGGNAAIADYVGEWYEIGFGGGGDEPPNFASKYRIGRYAGHEPDEVLSAIERESARGGTVPIMLHNIVTGSASGNKTTVGELRNYCEAIEAVGMDVVTPTEYAQTL